MAKLSPELLLKRELTQLESWIGKKCHFELLYKISRDGLSAGQFHNLCDNKGPTATVLYSSNGNVFGGYLSESWNSNNSTIKDERAFLFQLRNRNKIPPYKSDVLHPEFAACGVQSWGPTFGGFRLYLANTQCPLPMLVYPNLFDLCTFSDVYNNPQFQPGNCGQIKTLNQQSFVINGAENLGITYKNTFAVNCPLSEGCFMIEDLEVYLVKEDELWREMPEWNMQTFTRLRDFAVAYVPVTEEPTVNILLVGQVGAGKSSLINTFNSVIKREIIPRVLVGSSKQGFPTNIKIFPFIDPSTRKALNFNLCTAKGLEEHLGHNLALTLGESFQNNYEINQIEHVSTPSNIPRSQNQCMLNCKIHFVVFVVDGSTFEVMQEGILEKLLEANRMVKEKDMLPLVFVTKIDRICRLVEEDVKNVFSSKCVEEIVGKIAAFFNIPNTQVLPVKNFEKEESLNINMSILALMALKKSLSFADSFLENQYGLQLGMKKLKKMSLSD